MFVVPAVVSGCLVFLAGAIFTRAPGKRVLAAMISAIAVAVINIAADILAHQLGWWHYPGGGSSPAGPIDWYIGAALGVAGLTHIGWRAHRRFGAKGTAIFLIALASYGALRDALVSRVTDLIVFGPGAIPWIADFAGWVLCGAAAISMQRLVLLRAGPEHLRRRWTTR